MFTKFKMWFDGAAAGAGGSGAAAGGTAGAVAGNTGAAAGAGAEGDPAAPADFDAWFGSLDPAVQAVAKPLLDARFSALENTVKATRKERDDLAKEFKIMAGKAEKGSQAEADLLARAADLDEANRRADFFADAPTQECKNPKAAYAIATASDLFTKSGNVDWKGLREAAPELFGKPGANAGAGAGTGRGQPGTVSMNDYIRSKAGAQ